MGLEQKPGRPHSVIFFASSSLHYDQQQLHKTWHQKRYFKPFIIEIFSLKKWVIRVECYGCHKCDICPNISAAFIVKLLSLSQIHQSKVPWGCLDSSLFSPRPHHHYLNYLRGWWWYHIIIKVEELNLITRSPSFTLFWFTCSRIPSLLFASWTQILAPESATKTERAQT